jgi:hypothetical protein
MVRFRLVERRTRDWSPLEVHVFRELLRRHNAADRSARPA